MGFLKCPIPRIKMTDEGAFPESQASRDPQQSSNRVVLKRLFPLSDTARCPPSPHSTLNSLSGFRGCVWEPDHHIRRSECDAFMAHTSSEAWKAFRLSIRDPRLRAVWGLGSLGLGFKIRLLYSCRICYPHNPNSQPSTPDPKP